MTGVLLAGCAASAAAGKSGSNLGVGATVFPGGSGPRVPAVTGKLLNGQKFSLASYHGHVVVLNFWASWCPVCRQEAPDLAAVARQSAPSGVRFLGVDVADNVASARAYTSNFRISYPSLDDPGDIIALGFRNTIPISDFPSTLVVARNGRLAGRIIGAVTHQGLMAMIMKAEADPA